MRTGEAAIGRWGEIFEHYGLPPINRKQHYKGECPSCGRKGKLRIDDLEGKGTWICVCGSGDGWGLLRLATGKEFSVLAKEVDQLIGNTFKAEKKPEPKKPDNLTKAIQVWNSGSPVKHSNVHEYLKRRNIFEIPDRAVKCCQGNMFAIATDDKADPVYSHTTYLDGPEKAKTETQKRMLTLTHSEPQGSIAIRMYQIASTLGIAEGIETALAARGLFKCAVWATMNSTFMKRFRAPNGVQHLIIFADNDRNGTGLAAAFECGNRNILKRGSLERVTVRWPGKCCDFNDLADGEKTIHEWVLTR